MTWLKPSRVFISGANGFIGRAVGDRYRQLGIDVCGMDMTADSDRGIVAGDLRNPAGWAEYVAGCDLFVHCAAVVSMSADWSSYQAITVKGTRDAVAVAGVAGVRRFVHLSSIAAGGWCVPEGANERWPVVIGEEYRYGVAKAASEHVVLAAHASGEIECVIVRPGDVYGPGARVWIEMVLQMCRDDSLILPDEGTGRFGPVYIDDLVDGIQLAAGCPEARGEIFTLAGDEWTTAAEFIAYHRRWAGRTGPAPTVGLDAALRNASADGSRGEGGPDLVRLFARQGTFTIDKARALLGYAPRVSLAEGMRRSETWLRETGALGPSDVSGVPKL
ncbi:NAD(P)-dependent oxidoreductase [soil metagenome]